MKHKHKNLTLSSIGIHEARSNTNTFQTKHEHNFDLIQEAKWRKDNLTVVGLDLTNAYNAGQEIQEFGDQKRQR